MKTSNFKFKTLMLTLVGVLCFSIGEAYAMGSVYSDGRAFLRPNCPSGAGKVYVGKSASETTMATPASSSFKACNSSTTAAMTQQEKGTEKKTWYHFFAQANPGYKFTGWYDPDDKLLTMTDSTRNYYRGMIQSGTMALNGDLHAYVDCYAGFVKCIQMSFVRPTNGEFTIRNNGATVSDYATFTVDGRVFLTAQPAPGYKLRGWYTTTNGGATKTYVAFGTTYEPLSYTSNVTIGAEFVPDDGKATFWIKGTNQLYDNLTAANTAAASSSSKTIVVVSDGVVGAGTYNINSGVTLLIPFREVYDIMKAPRQIRVTNSTASTMKTTTFRKLSLADGAIINCYGAICVCGTLASVSGNHYSSFPVGTVGLLDMSKGGQINMKSGSNLYCWGYVKGQDMDQGNNTTGCGQISAESGSHVWEIFQVGDWRGGGDCLTIYNNSATWRYFPFQAWTIQNVEVPVTYVSGSKCHCYWSIFGNGEINTINFVAISDKNGGGIFQISPQGSVKKWYDPTTDRICVELGGASVMDAISLNVLGEDFSSEDYNLPLPANVHVILANGSNSAISKPLVAHAGSIIEVKSGGKLTIGGTLYLFDKDDWDMYCMNKYYGVYNSPSVHFDRGTGATNDILEDATIIADGTVTVTGNLYATAHGANIMGNNAGTLTYSKLPGNTTMVQCKERVKNVSVAVRSANLHNENGSYTKGSVATYKNVNGRWFLSSKSTPKSNKTYDFTYIKSGDVYGTGGTNATVSACYSKDQTGTDLRDKWANIKASICDDWWDGIDDGHKYNYYENNAWHQFIKTTMTVGEDEDAMDIYSGTNGKLYAMNEDCDVEEFADIDGNCQYTIDGVKKVLIGNSFVNVVKNSDDEAYHKADAATTYYICFSGCVWHPATKETETGKTPAYTVEGTNYIWFNGAWLGVQWDSSVSLYYSLSPTNVKIYYEYVNSAWVLATPVAEVETASGTEQVYSLANALTKAGKGGPNVTVRLLKSFTSPTTFSYSGGNNCNLDLNGYTLTISKSSPVYVGNDNTKVIIKDQSAAGTGKIFTKFSRSDDVVYGLNVTKGSIILNSGTVHIENTHASQGARGAVVANGYSLIINGGTLEAVSKGDTRGIAVSSSTTSKVTINGGTVSASTSSVSASSYGIFTQGGTLTINGGKIKAVRTATPNSDKYVWGVYLYENASKLVMTGGEIEGNAQRYVFGLKVGRAGITSTEATITGGKIKATTTSSANAYALQSFGQSTISGDSIIATAKTSAAYGVMVYGGTTTIKAGTAIKATGTSNTRGFYLEGGTLNVKGGTIESTTTSTTTAYGIYCAKAGNVNTEGGEFKVTAKTTTAYAAYVPADATGVCTLDGGKFMVKNNNGAGAYADYTSSSYVNNTDAPTGKLVLAGGYYNLTPSNTYVQGGKTVKDLDPTAEASLISAGYKKKIVGAEKTVTWKNYDGTVLATTLSEGGKHPQWEGETPTYDFGESTGIFDGWCTAASNGGTYYSGELPAIGGTDPTYFAHYRMIVAEVSINGVTTPYETPEDAWAAAMATGHTQALIRLLANVTNVGQLTFAPADANAIITLDLNGHSWTMDGSSAASQKSPMLLVNKTGSKLIVTDNSTSANGYLLNEWNSTAAILYCARVQAGELVLERGALKSHHTGDANRAEAVYVTNASSTDKGKFTMLGGTVEAWGASTPRGINLQATSAGVEITSGTVKATGSGSAPYALLAYGQASISGDAVIEAVSTNGVNGSYAVTAHSLGNIRISGSPKIKATVDGYAARGLSAVSDGTIEVESLDSVIATAPNNKQAFAVYAESTGSIIVHDGVFKTHSKTGQSTGVHANGNSTITVHGGIWNITSEANNNRVIMAQGNSTVNVTGGNFTVDQTATSEVEAIRCYVGTTLNISGGTFTVKENGAIARNAIVFLGGTMNISGSAMFKSKWGIIADNTSGLTANTACSITIDGGTFDLSGFCFKVKPTTKDGFTMTPTVTVNGGKFMTGGNTMDYANTPVERLIINGGYYNKDSDGRLSVYNATTNPTGYVRSPNTVETLTSGPEYEEGYRKYVGTRYHVTWKFAGATVKEEDYRRGETPSFGSGSPVPEDGNTYEFTGWSPTPEPITANTTFNAVYTKYEAEVLEGEATSGVRYEHFADAFEMAKTKPVSTIKVLSNLDLNTTLFVDSAALTRLDLNNHVITFTGSSNHAFKVNREGAEWVVTDNSVAKGGRIDVVASYNGPLNNTILTRGTMRLEGGELRATNSYASKAAQALVLQYGDFQMTGGIIRSTAATNAEAIRMIETGTSPTAEISGGKLIANTCTVSGTDTTWNAYSYAIYASKGHIHVSGTAELLSQAGSAADGIMASTDAYVTVEGGSVTARIRNASVHSARAIYIYGGSKGNTISDGTFLGETTASNSQNAQAICISGAGTELTVTGGSFTSRAFATQSHCVYVNSGATLNIAGGSFYATTSTPGSGNVDIVRVVQKDAVLNITGGIFTASESASKGIRAAVGTVNISGNPIVKVKSIPVYVADFFPGGTGSQIAKVTINGGTFISENDYTILASKATSGDNSTASDVVVNGGYFWSANSSQVAHRPTGGSLDLNGGYYNETSGTTNHKTNLGIFIDGTTTIADLSPKKTVTVDETIYTFDYELLTDFTITWKVGEETLKEETLKSGTMPSYEITSFVRNDSTFYNPSWTPTPVPAAGDATYQAVGEYYEAKVTVAAKDSLFEEFSEAWDYAMEQTTATITLLNNITRTETLIYRPENENARHTFDLNNFTLQENTKDRLLGVNKADAVLTITDNSAAKGGRLYKKMSSSVNMFTCVVYKGELKVTGGTLYAENELSYSGWNITSAVYMNNSEDAKLTVTGGTLQAEGKDDAFTIYGYGTTTITGGTIKSNVTGSYGGARSIYSLGGTVTISDNAKIVVTGTTNVIGVLCTAWINADGSQQYAGNVTINGGDFDAVASNQQATAYGVFATGVSKYVNNTAYGAHGTITVNGGDFYVNGTHDNASAVCGVVAAQHYTLDDATPHTKLACALGEVNVTGGTFLVETRNSAGNILSTAGNTEAMRSFGTLNVSGGTFTINTAGSAMGIRAFYGTLDVSGTPTFNVNTAGAAYGIRIGDYIPSYYCDKDIANNRIYVTVSGGTYNVTTTGNVTAYGVGVHGQGSATISGTSVPGYAVEGHLTLSGGVFNITSPHSAASVSVTPKTTATGDGFSTISTPHATITGGKFKLIKSGSGSFTWSSNIAGSPATSQVDLQGGFYNDIGTLDAYATNLPTPYYRRNLEAGEPEKLEGYNYEVCECYTLTWTTDGDPLTGTYTSGRTKVGTTIVPPATPTKTGYVFKAWTPAVAETMPAANTEYTATWNTVVASVTINGNTTYYTSLSEAFAAANASDTYEPKITILQTVTGITSTLSYTNANQNGILDLNNCTLSSSTLEFLLVVNSSTSKTLTITDSSSAKNGEIHIEANRDWVNVVGVWKGKLILNNGKIYGQNTSTTTDKNGTRALYLVEGQQAEINGGTLEAKGLQKAYAIFDNDDNNNDKTRAGSTITINNGTFKATTTARNIAYGIISKNSTVTINGGTFTVTSETYDARGIHYGGATLTLNGGTFHVKAKTYQAYGIAPYWIDSSHRTYLKIPSTSTVVVNDTAGTTNARAIDAGYARHTIDAGTFNAVTLTDAKAYGIYAQTEYVYVTGGTFNVEAGKSLAAGNANKKEAYGIYMCRSLSSSQPVRVEGSASFTVKADSYAYGLYATSILSTTGRDGTRNSWAEIKGGSFDVQAATNAWGVYTMGNKGQMTIKSNTIDTVTTATVAISGGTIKVAATNAIGIQTMKKLTQGSFSRSPKTTVTGGKFNVSGTGAVAAYKESGLTTTEQNIQGGYYSIDDNLADYVVSPKRVFPTTAADKTAQGAAYNWKVVTGYAIAYKKGASGTGTEYTDYKAHGDAITLRGITFTRTGYTQDGWSTTDGATKTYDLSASYTANSAATLYPHWAANTNTPYTVKHYQQNLDGTYPSTPTNTDNLTGTTGASVTPAVKSYEGFTAPSTQSKTIAADGSMVVEYKYTRNSYTLTWNLGGGTVSVAGTGAAAGATGSPSSSVKFGASITVPTVVRANYVFTGWNTTPAATMPAANTTYTAQWTAAVASVTPSGGSASYYSNIKAAFDAANDASADVTIKLLATCSSSEVLTFAPTSAINGTLDLNNKTLTGSVNQVLTINKSGKKFTITDSSTSHNGLLLDTLDTNTALNAVIVSAGTLEVNSGNVRMGNASTAGTSGQARGIYVSANCTLTVSGTATVKAICKQNAYGVMTNGASSKVTVSGGTISGTTNTGAEAYGVKMIKTAFEMSGGTINATAYTNTAVGICNQGSETAATMRLTGGTINATTLTGATAKGIYPNWQSDGGGSKLTIPEGSTLTVNATAYTAGAYPIHTSWAISTVEDGTFNATTKYGSTGNGAYAAGFYADYNNTTTISGGTWTVTVGSELADDNADKKYAWGVQVNRGVVNVSGGTFTVIGGRSAAGVYMRGIATTATSANYTPEVNVTGGTFNVTGKVTDAWGVYAYHNGSGNVGHAGTINVSGGTFNVTSPNAKGINVSAAGTYGTSTVEPKANISGGKFNVSGTSAVASTATAATTAEKITGGYYSVDGNLEKYCVSPKHKVATTAEDKASIGSQYNWKVVEAYTLTWDLNGGTETTAGTPAGYVAVGATVTAPTVNKTGSTFNGWSPTVVSPMPSSDKTYTAQWTVNNYSITYKDQGGAAFSGTHASGYPTTHTYGTATTLKTATKSGYTFGGWFLASDCSGSAVTSLGATAYTADITLYAKWSEHVAQVTINGVTTPYTTLSDAFAAANESDTYEPKITILQTVTGITSSLSYTNANQNGILDLNNCTLSGTAIIVRINSTGSKTLTITDGSTAKGGKISTVTSTDYVNAVLVAQGKLIFNNGTIYGENTKSGTAQTRGVHVSPGQQLEVNGGTIEAKGLQNAYAIYDIDGGDTRAVSTITLNGGTIKASTTSGADARGAYTKNSNVTVNSGCTITATTKTSSAIGVYNIGGRITLNGGTITATATTSSAYGIQTGWVKNRGMYFTVPTTSTVTVSAIATTSAAYALNFGYSDNTIQGGTFNATTLTGKNARGIHSQTHFVRISGSPVFNVKAGKNLAAGDENKQEAYGIVCLRTGYYNGTTEVKDSVYISGTPEFNVETDAIAYGIFAQSATSTAAKPTESYNSYFSVRGGTFNVTARQKAYGIYATYTGVSSVADKAPVANQANVVVFGGEFVVSSANAYGVFLTIPNTYSNTLGSATATPTITINGGKFKVSGTGAAAARNDYRVNGITQQIYGGYFSTNANLSASVMAPKVPILMSAAECTSVGMPANSYKVAEVPGEPVDIINWSGSTLTINASGWTGSGWPYTVNGTVYYKDEAAATAAGSDNYRDADRTLTIPYSGAEGSEITITVTNKDGEVVSQHTYIVPIVITGATTLATASLLDVYVNGTTLTVNGNITVKNVYVGADAILVINSGKTLTADSLFLRTTINQSAELVKTGNIAGTTNVFYTRIVKDNSAYYQFGLPWSTTSGVKVKDIRLANGKDPRYGTTWILRRYDEESRATYGNRQSEGLSNWKTLGENETITGGVGYEMSSTLKYYREFYFPVTVPSPLPTQVAVTHTDGAAGATESGWNVLVSPLTKTYTQTPVPEAVVISWMRPAGFEQAMPSSIPPATAFAYQAAETGFLSFAGSAIVWNNAPRRIKAVDEETRIQWIQLDIEDNDGVGDQTSVYSHPERYDNSYQTGIDVSKQMLTGPHAIIYSLPSYGAMAFAGVADEVLKQGVPLTVYSPSAQELTITMRDNDWLNRLEYVYLLDTETGIRTDLFIQGYSFDVEAGTTEGRFILQGQFKSPQNMTDIETGEVSDDGKQVRKLLIRDKMYIQINGQLYDATGKQVRK